MQLSGGTKVEHVSTAAILNGTRASGEAFIRPKGTGSVIIELEGKSPEAVLGDGPSFLFLCLCLCLAMSSHTCISPRSPGGAVILGQHAVH
jgi:hypothetical protein